LITQRQGGHKLANSPLKEADPALKRGELYERLLRQFADREVRKAGSALPDAQIRQVVEEELIRLSIVAFAMFIRDPVGDGGRTGGRPYCDLHLAMREPARSVGNAGATHRLRNRNRTVLLRP
jgi:hypothetical protein